MEIIWQERTFASLMCWPTQVQSDEWFKSDNAKKIKHEYEAKSIAAQLIQALGRPRSRKVSDEMGNCLSTAIYITLPDNVLGRSIEQHIQDEFPGVVIESWDYQMDGPTAGNSVVSNLASAVIKYMKNLPPGKYTVADVSAALSFDAKQRDGLKDGLKKKRKVYQDLAAVGVAYVVEGERRGAKSYLVKND